jgi:peptide chain release factor 1
VTGAAGPPYPAVATWPARFGGASVRSRPMKTPTLDPKLHERLSEAERRFEEVNEALTSREVLSSPEKLREYGQERSHLEPVVASGRRLRTALVEYRGALELLEGSDDPEMRAMAEEEIARLEERIEELSGQVRELLVPEDPLADRAAVVEIRAGTGGDEAGLFAADLMRMYQHFAEKQGWAVELMSLSEGIPGSIKEAIFTVRGRGVYGRLRYESGVHRVQRVPATEAQGRIHTSAATVAVLPEAEEVDLQIDPQDLRIDVFRSSGPGGQSVNTTDSAVRITHIPTGLVVSCQDEKSQHKNKAKALKVLRSRLLDRMIAEREAERALERKTQVGTGDRSGKIRTYNFPQNRVTDHRIGLTVHQLEDVLDGRLDELIGALRLAAEEETLGGEK